MRQHGEREDTDISPNVGRIPPDTRLQQKIHTKWAHWQHSWVSTAAMSPQVHTHREPLPSKSRWDWSLMFSDSGLTPCLWGEKQRRGLSLTLQVVLNGSSRWVPHFLGSCKRTKCKSNPPPFPSKQPCEVEFEWSRVHILGTHAQKNLH